MCLIILILVFCSFPCLSFTKLYLFLLPMKYPRTTASCMSKIYLRRELAITEQSTHSLELFSDFGFFVSAGQILVRGLPLMGLLLQSLSSRNPLADASNWTFSRLQQSMKTVDQSLCLGYKYFCHLQATLSCELFREEFRFTTVFTATN